MGLLGTLLLLPITGPVNGLLFVARTIRDEVDAGTLDEGRIQDELAVLSLRYDLGEIALSEYLAQEEMLLERLNAVRADREARPPRVADAKQGGPR